MNWSYLFKHWFGTLLLGPIVGQIIIILTNQENQVFDFLEFYIFYLLFGLFFSSPTYILYAILYWILSSKDISKNYSKSILISFASIGIIITFLTLNGMSTFQGIISYMIPSLFLGLFLKLNFKVNQ